MSSIAEPVRSPVVAVIGWQQETNERLVSAWSMLGVRAAVVSPFEADVVLRAGDVALGRLDVLESLDGVQPGLAVLDVLEARAVRVVNGHSALLNAHDKLRTADLLQAAGLPHPVTACVRSLGEAMQIELPLVIKPRFGSWGHDVVRCDTPDDLAMAFARSASRRWFRRHGAIAQKLIPSPGFDLRVVVAAGHVVGATERVARAGEWRTNVALGGTRHPARLTHEAKALAVAAATVVADGGLVGVDLLPVAGGHIVLELNGAVEFDRAYDIGDVNVFEAAARALDLIRPRRLDTTHSRRRLQPDHHWAARRSAQLRGEGVIE